MKQGDRNPLNSAACTELKGRFLLEKETDGSGSLFEGALFWGGFNGQSKGHQAFVIQPSLPQGFHVSLGEGILVVGILILTIYRSLAPPTPNALFLGCYSVVFGGILTPD